MADISIAGVERRYGDFTALHAIDLEIQDQEFLVLLGASGCGKTTLLRLIAGLDRQSSGQIKIGTTCRRAIAASPWCFKITRSFRI